MEKKGLIHTALSMDLLEVDVFPAELRNQRNFRQRYSQRVSGAVYV
jgi:hypothetical protein